MPDKRLSSLFERLLGFFRAKKQEKPATEADLHQQKTNQAQSIISQEFNQSQELSESQKQKPIFDFKKTIEKELSAKKPAKSMLSKNKPKKIKKLLKNRLELQVIEKKPATIFEAKKSKLKRKKTKTKTKPKIKAKKFGQRFKQKKPIQKKPAIAEEETEITAPKTIKHKFKKPEKFKPIFETIEKKPETIIKTAKKTKAKKEKKPKQKPLKIIAQNIQIVQPKQRTIKQTQEETEKQIGQEPAMPVNQTSDFAEQKEGELNIAEQISFVKEKIKHLKTQFYKRGIDEEEFRKKMFDYNEELHLLEVEQKKGKKTINPALLGKSFDSAAIGSIASEMFKQKQQPRERIIERVIERPSAKKTIISKPEVIEKGGIITFGGKEEEKDVETFVRREKEFEPEIISLGEENSKANSESLRFAIERKAAGKVDVERLKSIESKIDTLMKQYNISETEIKSEVERLDASKLVKDFDKLINLIELEHKTNQLSQGAISYNPFDKTEQQQLKKQEVKSVIKEIQMHRIVTDLDRILSFVKENKTVALKDIFLKLNIDRKRIIENAEILEKNGLVKIDYPPVGDMRISDVSYTKPTMFEKKKKKQLGELIQKASKEK